VKLLPVLLALSAGGWREDRAWHDGQAELCVYEATRTIYGLPREHLARAYTDLERADPRTTVKTGADTGLAVFKHHWSEIVPTGNYDYRFSTMSYLLAKDLSPFKLSVSTQEDCGASFKEIWHEEERMKWEESVYFPGAGRRRGGYPRAEKAVFLDALTLSLRDFPFDAPAAMHLRVIPSQKSTRAESYDVVERTVAYAGRRELDLPIGRTEAHELELRSPAGEVEARYWFAADGSAPMLHALVRYEGPGGVSYRLRSHARVRYWER